MANRRFRFQTVDVFTETALEGNPLAVVLDADELDASTMQRIAGEFNLSETVFIQRSERADCVVRFRIFTPRMEMRFAGHPTIGGAWVARAAQIVPHELTTFSIEEPVGAVPVVVEGDPVRIWLTTPPITFGATFDRSLCAEVLGIETHALLDLAPQLVTAGNPNIYIGLRDPRDVDRAWIELAGVRRLHGGAPSADCIFVFAPVAGGAYSRMFSPEHGVVEDPATGSATGPLAAYMMQNGLLLRADGTTMVSEQGTKMGRRSLLHVRIRGIDGCEGIDVGGSVVPVSEGTLTLSD